MHGSAMKLPLGRGRSPLNWSIIDINQPSTAMISTIANPVPRFCGNKWTGGVKEGVTTANDYYNKRVEATVEWKAIQTACDNAYSQ